MNTLVERLRGSEPCKDLVALRREAADIIDGLQAALTQALRQWKMYAEMEEGRDLKTESSAEAEMYREALKISER